VEDQIKRVIEAAGRVRNALTPLRAEIVELVKLGDSMQVDLDRLGGVSNQAGATPKEELRDDGESGSERVDIPEGVKPTLPIAEPVNFLKSRR